MARFRGIAHRHHDGDPSDIPSLGPRARGSRIPNPTWIPFAPGAPVRPCPVAPCASGIHVWSTWPDSGTISRPHSRVDPHTQPGHCGGPLLPFCLHANRPLATHRRLSDPDLSRSGTHHPDQQKFLYAGQRMFLSLTPPNEEPVNGRTNHPTTGGPPPMGPLASTLQTPQPPSSLHEPGRHRPRPAGHIGVRWEPH